MKRKIVKGLIISICILLVLSIGVYVFYILPSERKLDAVRTMAIENINLDKIEDGIYNGEYHYGTFTYKVKVSVQQHKINDIKVTDNRDSSHAKKAEEVINNVLESQKINVDVISGATTTSKALLKAIENALSSEHQK